MQVSSIFNTVAGPHDGDDHRKHHRHGHWRNERFYDDRRHRFEYRRQWHWDD